MNEFDFLRNVTIGQYIPTDSVIHRLDPRAKLVAIFLFIAMVIIAKSLIAVAVATVVLFGITRLAKLPTRYVMRGLLLSLPILLVIFTLNFLIQGWTEPSEKIYFEFFFIRATRYSMHLIAMALIRIVTFLFIISLLTMTSKVTELTHGIEMLFKPLTIFRFPAHELALTMMISLRFVPTLAGELERITKAQASRCGDVRRSSTWNPITAGRAMLPMIVPLFINALRSAEDLILAMEARCYMGGAGRTKFVQFKARGADFLAVAVVLAFGAFIVFTTWPPVRTWIPAL